MKHTLTLTRWHKVAERINAALKEREARMVAAFTGATISPWNKEGVEQKAAVMAARGIAARLAEVEAANRRIGLYRAVLDRQSVDMVQPEHVRHVPALAVPESESSWGRREPSRITLQVADAALLAELASKLAREQVRSHALLDEIADLNREKLELDVASELHEIAGLAA